MEFWGLRKKRTDDPTANSPSEFYSKCIADFHKEALTYNVAQKGLIFIPELMTAGQRITLAFLNDDFLRTEYGSSPIQFYFAVMAFSLEAGMLFAVKWHERFDELNDYVDIVAIVGPAEDASNLMKKHFPANIAEDAGHTFFEKIYERWMVIHTPHWDKPDSQQYTFSGMMAAYQLGVSMMLEKPGY